MKRAQLTSTARIQHRMLSLMRTLTSISVLRAAVLFCSAPLACVGHQTFDDGSDTLKKGKSDSGARNDDGGLPPAARDGGAGPTDADSGPTEELMDDDPAAWFGDDAGSGPSAEDDGAASPERDFGSEIIDVTYADGLFVAVGTTGSATVTGPSSSLILTSEDGSNWTQRYWDLTGALGSVTRGEARWVAVGQAVWTTGDGQEKSPLVLVSDDGLIWEQVAVPALEGPTQVIWANDEFLMVDDEGRSIWASVQGEEWEQRTSPGPVSTLASNGQAVYAGRRDGLISFSDDGARVWSDTTLSLNPEFKVDRLWLDGDVMAGSASFVDCFGEDPSCFHDYLLRQDLVDGWEVTEVTDEPFVLKSIAFGNDIVVGCDGGAVAYREPGGSEWTLSQRRENDEARLSTLAFGDGVFVAAGFWGLRYSTDGKSWSRYESVTP